MEADIQETWVDKEVWAKIFFNGCFFTFQDMSIQVEIRIQDSEICTTVMVLPSIDEANGKVDITNLLHTFLDQMKKNPGKKVSASLTSFGRRMRFNKDLLNLPIPRSLIDLFKDDSKKV